MVLSAQEGEAILDAAKRQGIDLPYGCRAGGCSVCKVKVVTGDVQYQDGEPMGFDEEDMNQGKILICVAVPLSDLVLETTSAETDWEPW